MAFRYTVREPGKDGGIICTDFAEAVRTAVKWRIDTQIRCDIWVSGDDMLSEGLAIHAMATADAEYAFATAD